MKRTREEPTWHIPITKHQVSFYQQRCRQQVYLKVVLKDKLCAEREEYLMK